MKPAVSVYFCKNDLFWKNITYCDFEPNENINILFRNLSYNLAQLKNIIYFSVFKILQRNDNKDILQALDTNKWQPIFDDVTYIHQVV